MDKTLKQVLPDTKEVRVSNDEVIVVGPLPFGKWPKALELSKPFMGLIQKWNKAAAEKARARAAQAEADVAPPEADDDEIPLMELMAEGGEALMDLIAHAIGKPRVFLDTVPPDRGLVLLAAVIEVNRDFFVQKVRPMVQGALLEAKEKGLGSNSLTSLLERAIAGTTS